MEILEKKEKDNKNVVFWQVPTQINYFGENVRFWQDNSGFDFLSARWLIGLNVEILSGFVQFSRDLEGISVRTQVD